MGKQHVHACLYLPLLLYLLLLLHGKVFDENFCSAQKMAQSYMSIVGQSTMMGHNHNIIIVFQLKD